MRTADLILVLSGNLMGMKKTRCAGARPANGNLDAAFRNNRPSSNGGVRRKRHIRHS
jgi:hypothetical protein